MIKRFSTFIFAFIAVLCAMAQTGMPYDYQEVALGKCADGSDLKCRYIPAEGKLKRFTITRKMPYMLIFDDGGARVLDKTTLRKIADCKDFCPKSTMTAILRVQMMLRSFQGKAAPPSTISRAIRCGQASMG